MGLNRPSPDVPVGQQVQLFAHRSAESEALDVRETLGRCDDAIDSSGLVEDLDAHGGGRIKASRGVDAQATHARAVGVVGQVQMEVGLFERGNSVPAHLKTGDELAAAVGDV